MRFHSFLLSRLVSLKPTLVKPQPTKQKARQTLRLPAVAIHRPTGFLSASGGSTRSRLALRSFASVQPVRTSLIAPTPQHWLKAVFPQNHSYCVNSYFQQNNSSYNP